MMKNFEKFLIVMFLSIFTLINSSCYKFNEPQQNNSEYKRVRMVMSTSGTEKGINTLVAKKLSDLVKKESGGNVIIEVYDNDQLAGGNTTKGVRMLANGSVDLAVYTSGTLATLDSRISVATLPWTFSDYKQARKIIDETGGDFYKKILAGQGLIYLGAIHNGFRQISNNRNPIEYPEDLYGMKIRVLGNEGYRLFFECFDVEPMPMSRSEMSTALRQGNIDGHDMGIFQSGTDKLNEIEKYITIWNCAYETYIFAINTKTYDRLEEKTQKLLKEKSKEACEWGRDHLEKNERSIRKQFAEKGVLIKELSNEELEPFKERVRPLIEKMKLKYGEEACKAFGIK